MLFHLGYKTGLYYTSSPVSESSGGPVPSPTSLPSLSPQPRSITALPSPSPYSRLHQIYPTSNQTAGNALVTPAGSRVSTGDSEHLLFDRDKDKWGAALCGFSRRSRSYIRSLHASSRLYEGCPPCFYGSYGINTSNKIILKKLIKLRLGEAL
ncbi:hypothetical protein EVAR_13118_1 [Eumeta japonica]|uniref:Uncharacterized protein n=1 Tax=Eumeta variegata TaxID=151549 RepID=A0A4C1U9W5_EUMVA|nr:hypothetical protein EVAR_13118_1 [Eumeta japonica]